MLLRGTSRGIGTDANGEYALQVPAQTPRTELLDGYGGYQNVRLDVAGNAPVTVSLTPQAKAHRKHHW